MLSPRDWDLVASWHSRGIPIGVVLEALESGAERGRRRRRSSAALSFSRVVPLVEEAWNVILAGRASPIVAVDAADPSPASRRRWQEALDGSERGSPLALILSELLELLDAGADPGTMDRRLDAALVEVVPEEIRSEIDRQVAADLAPYRSRMDGPAFVVTRARAVADRLRNRLRLPRLARGG